MPCRLSALRCSALHYSPPQALAAKTRGNDAFTKGDFAKAVDEFSEAIAQDPTDAVFYSNRSGAYASLKQFQQVRSGRREERRKRERRRPRTDASTQRSAVRLVV